MAFAASKRKRISSRRKPIEQLKLTSMIDMFTILLIYLLKSYSPTEMPSHDPHLQLPVSISTKVPLETTIIQVAQNMIIVDGHPIVMVDFQQDHKMYILKINKKGRAVLNAKKEFVADKEVAETAILIPGLLSMLEARREHYQKLAQNMNSTFKGEVTIMCDKEMPYKVLKKVMATAGKAGFGDFKFAAYKGRKG